MNTHANFFHRTASHVLKKVNGFAHRAAVALNNRRGENYVGEGVRVLIAMVIGALLLAGLYKLFGDTILPTVTSKVQELFNYHG